MEHYKTLIFQQKMSYDTAKPYRNYSSTTSVAIPPYTAMGDIRKCKVLNEKNKCKTYTKFKR